MDRSQKVRKISNDLSHGVTTICSIDSSLTSAEFATLSEKSPNKLFVLPADVINEYSILTLLSRTVADIVS
jgi:hypothetical protein